MIAVVQEQGREQVSHGVAAEMKRKGQCDSLGDRYDKGNARGRAKGEDAISRCILQLPQLIKNFYINTISSLDHKLLEDRAHVIFTQRNERGSCLVNACWEVNESQEIWLGNGSRGIAVNDMFLLGLPGIWRCGLFF